ncbi:MAG TPA: hypothetical protein VL651_08080 [Bacteroidia bacterium]|jgi:hypothetical protein|nr:hypothetical protein [Bacteroidia bacterium]
MKNLSKDWITEKYVDVEYKKYVLLAWLQDVERSFREVKLYPPLAELLDHYRMAKTLLGKKNELESLFPKRLSGFDAKRFMLRYENLLADERIMNEIGEIIDFSIPKFEEWLREGKHIYEFLEKEIRMEMIGIVPMHLQEGYLLLRSADHDTRVYSYAVKLFEDAGAAFRGLHTRFVSTFTNDILHSYDTIKLKLISDFPAMPNPAVYAAETSLEIPVEETFLPIAKRMMIREIAMSDRKE